MRHCPSCKVGLNAGTVICGPCGKDVTTMFTIGADPRCDLVIDQPMVSSWHLRLHKISPDRYRLQDMGSTNGTFVNERRIRSMEARANDIIRIGSEQFPLQTLVAKVEAALSPYVAPQPTRNRVIPSANARYVRCICGAVTLSGTTCECGRVVE